MLDERHVVPGVRFAVDAYVTFARTRPWVEAVASGLTEMFSGHLMQRRVGDMLAHYDWIEPRGPRVLHEPDRGGLRRRASPQWTSWCGTATTRAAAGRAIAALSFKCDVLWSMLDAIERAAAKE